MSAIQTGDVLGDYRVLSAAGSGGMGSVYKIEHVITHRIEALKLLPAGAAADPDLLHRFEREIQVQARLNHPNIVALYNALREGATLGLVMEYVDGESLQAMLERGPLPLALTLDYAAQVLRALEYAHAAGVIHRDISPANIIITREGVAKLTDFGLARNSADLRLSTSGAPIGSPWYMSPEQVRGNPVDARTDLYGLGAVLYEMLTGRKLFQAEGAFAVMRAQVESQPVPPGKHNARIPAGLDAVVMKAIAKSPAARFQSAAEFRGALAAIEFPAARRWRIGRMVAMIFAPVVVVATTAALVPRPMVLRLVEPRPVIPAAPEAPKVREVEAPAAAAAVAVVKKAGVKRAAPRYALRITGADTVPAKTVRTTTVADPPVVVGEAPTPSVALPASETVKPSPPGNRLIRAVGKLNPFKKTNKN